MGRWQGWATSEETAVEGAALLFAVDNNCVWWCKPCVYTLIALQYARRFHSDALVTTKTFGRNDQIFQN
jgi:hypothetical protein